MSRTYRDSSFEDDRIMSWALTVGEGTDGLGAFVFVSDKEIVQAIVTKGLEKPFTVRIRGQNESTAALSVAGRRGQHVWSRKAFERVEA